MTKKQMLEALNEAKKLKLSEKNQKRLNLLIQAGKLYLRYKYGVKV